MPGTSTEQVVDKGIRQKSIHSFHSIHSFPDGSAFCPGAPKRVPSDSEKHWRVYTSSNVCHSHEWRVDTASGKTLKKQNACLHAVRHAVGKKIACIHSLRSVKQKNFAHQKNLLWRFLWLPAKLLLKFFVCILACMGLVPGVNYPRWWTVYWELN